MALAISSSGKCLGGSTFPLFMHYLLEHMGFSRGLTVIGGLEIVARSETVKQWLKYLLNHTGFKGNEALR